MITKLYSFYDLPFSHDTCHLFEHVLIRQFLVRLRRGGRGRAFYGWMHGQTIDSSVFFELHARSKTVVRLFEEEIANQGKYDANIIKQSILHIEAEIQAEIKVDDMQLLERQLQAIADAINDRSIHAVPIEDSLRITPKPSMFQKVAIVINVYDISHETQKAFLCLYPLVIDIIRDTPIDNESIYPAGKSPVVANEDGMGIAYRFIMRKSIDIKLIEQLIEQNLKEFEIERYSQYLDEYRLSFAHDDWSNAAPIQFYGQVGVKTNREELARLATPAHMQEILNKLTVQVRPVMGKLKKIDWNN